MFGSRCVDSLSLLNDPLSLTGAFPLIQRSLGSSFSCDPRLIQLRAVGGQDRPPAGHRSRTKYSEDASDTKLKGRRNTAGLSRAWAGVPELIRLWPLLPSELIQLESLRGRCEGLTVMEEAYAAQPWQGP